MDTGPHRPALVAGAVACGLAVGLGAFGAHGLQLDAKAQGWWDTAVQYQMYHGLALLACGLLAAHARLSRAPAWCFGAGALVFCGTLYAMALGAPRWLGAVTPVGGVLLLAGWAALVWQVRRPAAT